MIVPTVGRAVWFFPAGKSLSNGDQPQAATIAKVWDNNHVNLGVLSPTGSPEHWPEKIRLLQEGESAPENENYCMWMPYQIGQAAKAEALQRQLDENVVGKPEATPHTELNENPVANPEATPQQVSENAA